MNQQKFSIERIKTVAGNIHIWAFALLINLSIYAWYVFDNLGLTTAYNDSMSHLNLARLVIDNKEPGFSQIGGVWLPLNHILPLLLIWNDWAWHSGFAGSIFSMIAFVISGFLVYKIIKLISGNILAALTGALAFVLNLNILYLQSTPMTEPLYLFFFLGSVYFIFKWFAEAKTKYLPLIGLFSFLQVLTRYDGWFVVGFECLIVMIFEFIYSNKNFRETFGKLLVIGVPIVFGVGIWLLWNLLIFKDPLFFALGPYSAHAQQKTIDALNPLITKGNLSVSFQAYVYAVIDNIGVILTAVSQIGLIALIFAKNQVFKKIGIRLLLVLLLFSPFIFNVLALFLGFSILNVPELNWNPSSDPQAVWFNVRYGIMALPIVAVSLGVLAARNRIFLLLCALLIVVQTILVYNAGIITITDGTRGSSSFYNDDLVKYLQAEVKPTDNVLLAVSFFNPVAFKSGIQLSQIIHEGVSRQWPYAIQNPQHYATWIVMANGKTGDPVYTALVEKENSEFLKYYEIRFKGNHANIYKLKDSSQLSTKF